jgi:hypothetical protein
MASGDENRVCITSLSSRVALALPPFQKCSRDKVKVCDMIGSIKGAKMKPIGTIFQIADLPCADPCRHVDRHLLGG